MAFNPYIARVAGEAFDADQIEGDDPFYISDAELAQARVRDASNARRAARLEAARWTVTVKDLGDGRSELAA